MSIQRERGSSVTGVYKSKSNSGNVTGDASSLRDFTQPVTLATEPPAPPAANHSLLPPFFRGRAGRRGGGGYIPRMRIILNNPPYAVALYYD